MKQAYATTDSAEALALYTAGIPWFMPDMPCENTYTADWLKRYGFNKIEEAVAASRHGRRTFLFQVSEAQTKISQAYHAERTRLDIIGKDQPSIDLDSLTPEDLGRLCAYIQANRKFVENIWKKMPPKFAVEDGRGGTSIIGKDTSAADRQRLGIR